MSEASSLQQWGAASGAGLNMGDQVIYYRRPKGPDKEDSGWIVTADSISGTKLRDYAIRGFEPLMKYGHINRSDNVTQGRLASNPNEKWRQILEHPDGPSEFPLEQVLTFRWYRPDQCPVPETVFPQLEGIKVREYRCPECRRAPFVDIDGVGGVTSLANHLRIMHEWDRASLMAYGDRVGIDFNKADTGNLLVQDYEPNQAVRPKAKPKNEPKVEVESFG